MSVRWNFDCKGMVYSLKQEAGRHQSHASERYDEEGTAKGKQPARQRVGRSLNIAFQPFLSGYNMDMVVDAHGSRGSNQQISTI